MAQTRVLRDSTNHRRPGVQIPPQCNVPRTTPACCAARVEMKSTSPTGEALYVLIHVRNPLEPQAGKCNPVEQFILRLLHFGLNRGHPFQLFQETKGDLPASKMTANKHGI